MESESSSARNIDKAKDFAPKNDVDDDELHDDEYFEFEPVVTAFEQSMTTTRKNRKTRGVYGRFRGSTVGRAFSVISSSRKKNKQYQQSQPNPKSGPLSGNRMRRGSDHESGNLGDESSPEFARQPRAELSPFVAYLNEEDADVDLDSEQEMKTRSHSRSSSVEYYPYPTQTKPSVRRSLHRSYSMSMSTGTGTINNCNDNGTVQLASQGQPIRRTFQRSHSVAMGTTSSMTSKISNTSNHGFQSSNSLSWSAMNGDGGYWGENADPNSTTNDTSRNDLDAIERCGNVSGRKKMRARRHSCFGRTSLDRESSTSSSTGSSMASHNAFPSELGWLNPESSPSKTFVEDSANALSIFSSHSPSALSAASSSRKRGVCGSPVSDAGIDRDDWGLTLSGSSYCSDARRTSRSRSRIFSASESTILLAPPIRAPVFFADQQERQSSHGSQKNRRDEVMDESSDDESLFHHHSSPDSSFEMTVPAKSEDCGDQERKPAELEDSSQTIFDTMTSLEDLKFLVRELQKESQRHKVAFGMGDMWKVAPPMKWSGKRRTEFNGWTKGRLGFQVRSAGQGYTFLQIAKHRGSQVLVSLEAALVEHKKRQDEAPKQQQPFGTEPRINNEEPCPSTGMLLFSSHSFAPPDSEALPTVQPPMSIVKPDFCSSPEDVIMDDADEDLVNKISSLSMNEPPTSTTRSLSRMVTLSHEEPRRLQQDPIFRLSLESRASSRPSVEGATDVNFHSIFGASPRLPRGRQTKMSINSVGSFETVAAAPHRQSASPLIEAAFTENTAMAPVNKSLFVATPLMTQRRDWGSRPVEGRDWGSSLAYDETLMAELIRRFEEACRGDDPTETALGDPFENIPRSSSRLFNDLDIEGVDEEDAVLDDQRRNLERKTRRRQSSINKLRRMSLFAVAAGSRPRHPRESRSTAFRNEPIMEEREIEMDDPGEVLGKKEHLMATVFSFMSEKDLLTVASTVCTQWADWATDAHANLLLSSVAIQEADDHEEENTSSVDDQREPVLERSWKSIHGQFPWACYLASGGAKTVYRAHNIALGKEEAISVMDTRAIESMQIVANELAVSAMLSSLVRRAICPNFIAMRGVFTMANAPLPSHWGDEEERYPVGESFVPGKPRLAPQTPKGGHPGRYQYIRMELVNEGDAEELIKRQKDEVFDFNVARGILFQIAFGLFAAADKYSVKHYDIKLLNIFVHRDPKATAGLVLRYGLGSHIFAVKMPSSDPFIAKVADFGTANTVPDSNGQPVTMAHFTTLENTPPDFMILGDDATQGHEHDSFGLGLGMLHLFTGYRPYEEILEEVKCPPQLKARLRKIWENENVGGYSVIRTVLSDDPFETLYHTLYRFLVLFGIPEVKVQQKTCPKVWKAISDSLEPSNPGQGRNGRGARKRRDSDVTQYNRDCKKFSVRNGNNKYIARARKSLMVVDGGLDLLFSLCSFDPRTRGTAMSVLNSSFMEDLREAPGTAYTDGVTVRSYTSFSIHN